MVDLIFNNDVTWGLIQILFWSLFALPPAGGVLTRFRPDWRPARDRLLTGLDRAVIALNEGLGRAAMAAALGLVIVQILVVVLRYVFRIGLVELQELIIYLHAALFMAASGYALMRDAHVRVDVFYRTAPRPWKLSVNLAGVYILLMPTAALLFYVAWPYVGASWDVLESSKESSGLPVYPLKSMLLLFAVSVMLQSWVLAMRSFQALIGEPLGEPLPNGEAVHP